MIIKETNDPHALSAKKLMAGFINDFLDSFWDEAGKLDVFKELKIDVVAKNVMDDFSVVPEEMNKRQAFYFSVNRAIADIIEKHINVLTVSKVVSREALNYGRIDYDEEIKSLMSREMAQSILENQNFGMTKSRDSFGDIRYFCQVPFIKIKDTE